MQDESEKPIDPEKRHILVVECLKNGATARRLLHLGAMAGDSEAFAALVMEAQFLCSAVAEAGERHPEMQTRRAATESKWPVNVEADPAAVDKLKEWLKALGLGNELKSPFGAARGPKRARLDSPAQAISVMIWDWLWGTRAKGIQRAVTPFEERACELPPWTPENFDKWFSCGWEYYVAAFNGDVCNDQHALEIIATNDLGKNKPDGYVKDRVKKASAWWKE